MNAKVLAFQRPPIRQTTTVAADQIHTFETFTGRLAEWWPLDPFSFGGSARIASVKLEPRVGGEVIEQWHDGSTRSWGTLLVWDPPAGFSMTWTITGTPTEVEMRFLPLEDRLTRVDLEHRGWERLETQELDATCALPGGYTGGAFNRGWSSILNAFKEHLK
ncbi:SRPBCC domain-containing protein [Brevibacterium sp.]|uniref:SRPBCC domain-containing protein n=1 Tax=Brevibacterium sp. TaxID=1701 RepID=UPI002811CCAD|nr:SRPBCC domain-containing protein [Brevibacterium sp.]